MIERVVQQRPQWTTVLGSGLVLTGFVLFVVLFVTLLPILRDPVGAYGRWFPDEEPATQVAEVATDPPGVTTSTPAPAPESDDPFDELGLADLETSLEEAVGSVGEDITATLDGAVGSIGRSARGSVVVFLFIMAAFAIAVVAWRVARLGVMLLTQVPASPAPPAPPLSEYDELPPHQRHLEPV